MSVIKEFVLYLCRLDGLNSALSPVVQGDNALSVKIQYNYYGKSDLDTVAKTDHKKIQRKI